MARPIEEMAEAAQKLVWNISPLPADPSLPWPMVWTKRLAEQGKEIDKINKKFEIRNLKFRVLKITEVNINKDGVYIADAALEWIL